MTKEKALEIVKAVLATKSKKNVVTIKDGLQFRVAITILSQNYTEKQLIKMLN